MASQLRRAAEARNRYQPFADPFRAGGSRMPASTMDYPVDFHTPHAPWGAFATFTCGLNVAAEPAAPGGAGGFALGARHPANQNLYIGYRMGAGAWQLLPFFRPKQSRTADFVADGAPADGGMGAFQPVPPGRITRRLGLATDRFETGPFALTFFNAFERVEELAALPADRQRLLTAPVVAVMIEADNRYSAEPMEVVFGVDVAESSQRVLSDTHPALFGFATGTRYGFATIPGRAMRLSLGFELFSPERRDERGVHLLGSAGGVAATIPPGERREIPLCLGFYHEGRATTGIEARYFYTRHFGALEEVLAFGLEHHGALRGLATRADALLDDERLSSEQRWLIAQGVHSYLASTQLLEHDGRALWVVNEGEYRMLNTFDLLVDHQFFELAWWPWAVRDTLQLFAQRYSYVDRLSTPGGTTVPGGLSFAHDMGVDNQFAPPGRSSYELPHLRDCFSYMTTEQLLNWICTSVCYAHATGDWAWLQDRGGWLVQCASSLGRRDHPDAARRSGVMKFDSDRCGSGAEITTYDSLDVSLGQARNSLYLAVKTIAAWLLLEMAFTRLGEAEQAVQAGRLARQGARTVAGQFDASAQAFPAVFEGGNRSRIIPAIEGLVYPLYVELMPTLRADADLRRLLELLHVHLQTVLVPGVCLDAESGGWKLSSTSRNTWLSKVFLAQYVARMLFPDVLRGPAAHADDAHVRWQTSPVTRTFNFCDQVDATTGDPLGSRNYPRGVTAWLWLRWPRGAPWAPAQREGAVPMTVQLEA